MLRRSTKTGPSSGGASPKQNVLLAIIISPKHPSLPVIPPSFLFLLSRWKIQGRSPCSIKNSRVRLYLVCSSHPPSLCDVEMKSVSEN